MAAKTSLSLRVLKFKESPSIVSFLSMKRTIFKVRLREACRMESLSTSSLLLSDEFLSFYCGTVTIVSSTMVL